MSTHWGWLAYRFTGSEPVRRWVCSLVAKYARFIRGAKCAFSFKVSGDRPCWITEFGERFASQWVQRYVGACMRTQSCPSSLYYRYHSITWVRTRQVDRWFHWIHFSNCLPLQTPKIFFFFHLSFFCIFLCYVLCFCFMVYIFKNT